MFVDHVDTVVAGSSYTLFIKERGQDEKMNSLARSCTWPMARRLNERQAAGLGGRGGRERQTRKTSVHVQGRQDERIASIPIMHCLLL